MVTNGDVVVVEIVLEKRTWKERLKTLIYLSFKKTFAQSLSVISILSFLWTNAGGAQTGLGFKAALPEPATLSQSLAAGRSRAAHREMRPKFPLCGEGSAEFLPLLASAAGVALLPGGNEGPGGRTGKHFCFSKNEKKNKTKYMQGIIRRTVKSSLYDHQPLALVS